jgi:hypothetical protein
MMEPVAARLTKKGMQLVHRCSRCGEVRAVRAAQRTVQADDMETIVELMWAPRAVHPVARAAGSSAARRRGNRS